jgi:hypothetical protein
MQKTVNPNSIKFGGAFEARLVTLGCSPAPNGRATWIVRLLADKLAESVNAPAGISRMSVQKTLKNETRPHLSMCHKIPAEVSADFVMALEDMFGAGHRPSARN